MSGHKKSILHRVTVISFTDSIPGKSHPFIQTDGCSVSNPDFQMDGSHSLLVSQTDQAFHQEIADSFSLPVSSYCHIGDIPFVQYHEQTAVSKDLPLFFYYQKHGILPGQKGKKPFFGPGNMEQICFDLHHLIQIIPYVLVLVGGIIGINVFVVLLIGIVSGSVIVLATGATGQTGVLAVKALLENMGSGAAGMFETSMVAILVSAICALIREYGGFEALLGWIRKAFRGKRGGQIGMGLLVGAMDIATANNTVAIVMANPIAKEMSEEYGITPRKAASILDTFSCIFQGIIPYGAQMLVAIAAAHELGYQVSAFEIIPNLFYPFLLAVSSFFFIAIDGKKKA